MTYDVAVVGAGVVGGLIARELSRFNINVALLEKCNDVAMGTTKANSAIVHGGFDAQNGTLKAKLNVEGTLMMPEVCEKLSVPFKKNGSVVVAFSEKEMEHVKELFERGIKNGVPELSVIDQAELRRIEPNISDAAVGALLSESAGIVCTYELTIAAVENAVTNGVEFIRNCEVKAINENADGYVLDTTVGEISAKYIINAAGNFSDDLARMVGDDSIELVPRKGEYYVLDKSVGNLAIHTIFQCPNEMGKGILVTPTVDGNLLIGPTAINQESKEDIDTTPEGLKEIVEKA
ncbi:MAG: NAD(P)/FAD-dependent oxidoreductase, partial [Clostridia bacterium]|nr:NAD(P)/FAD-dependent oxidoreductase [Clostridia bacterium]